MHGAPTYIILQENSSSLSSGVADVFDSDMNFAENYVPWFIEADYVETNSDLGQEGMIDFKAGFEDQQTWDYHQDPTFPVGDMVNQDIIGNAEQWQHTLPEQFFNDSLVRHNSTSTEGGRAADFSSLKLNEEERSAVIEIAMPTTQLAKDKEENAASDDDAPRPKRRKASTSTSANHSPTEDYRKGHNAIEKRYRSNLNSKIQTLEQCLPDQELLDDELELRPARTTKSAILTRAINHIEFLQQNTKRLTVETETLKRQFEALEKLVLMSVEERVEKSDEEGHEDEGKSKEHS